MLAKSETGLSDSKLPFSSDHLYALSTWDLLDMLYVRLRGFFADSLSREVDRSPVRRCHQPLASHPGQDDGERGLLSL